MEREHPSTEDLHSEAAEASVGTERAASAPRQHGLTEIPEGVEIQVLPPELDRTQQRDATVLAVIATVCDIQIEDLYRRHKVRGKVGTARALASYILKYDLGLNEDEIARALKDRESASAIFNRAYDFKRRLKHNINVSSLYEQVKTALKPLLHPENY